MDERAGGGVYDGAGPEEGASMPDCSGEPVGVARESSNYVGRDGTKWTG